MKKLISAASALTMAASMLGAVVPFATGAADSTKGFELRAFQTKAGETAKTTISEDEIKAGDVVIPIGVYFKEGTADSKSVTCQWTVNSKDGDASNTNVTFEPYAPGTNYFDSAKEVTLADGSSGSLTQIIGFCGTIAANKKGDKFKETNAGTYNCDTQQKSWGCPNSWGSVVWLAPLDQKYKWSGNKSDDYPMFVFEATFKKGTPAGTYTIDFVDAEDAKKVQATMVEAEGGVRYSLPTKNLDVKGIEIVIGGSATSTPATTTAAPASTTKAPDSQTTAATTTAAPASSTNGGNTTIENPTDFPTADDFIITGENITAKPGETVTVNFRVSNPGNHLSATYVATVADFPAGMTYEMTDTEVYAVDSDKHGTKEYKKMGDTYQVDVIDSKTKDPVEVVEDAEILTLDVTIPADIASGTYNYSLKTFKVVEHAQAPTKIFYATLKPGTITIEGGSTPTTTAATPTTTKAPDSTTKAPDSTTKVSDSQTTTAAPTGKAVYGDTNCDGKVNIADVVLLNKWLNDAKSYNITAQGKLNADCCDAKGGEGLDKNDSDAIIRSIVHLVELPCASDALK